MRKPLPLIIVSSSYQNIGQAWLACWNKIVFVLTILNPDENLSWNSDENFSWNPDENKIWPTNTGAAQQHNPAVANISLEVF